MKNYILTALLVLTGIQTIEAQDSPMKTIVDSTAVVTTDQKKVQNKVEKVNNNGTKQYQQTVAPTEANADVATEKAMLKERLRSEKKALKEAEKREDMIKEMERDAKKLENEKKQFERKQEKIADAEKDLLKEQERLKDQQADLGKNIEKFNSKKGKGKLDAIEIEKENIKISKQQIKIKETEQDIIKAEKKLQKLR